LLPSESKLHLEAKISVKIDEYHYEGQVVLTDYRMIFKPDENSLKKNLKNPFRILQKDYFDLPIFLISRLEKTIDKINPHLFILEVFTKDNRQIRLVMANENKKLFGLLANSVNSKDINSYFQMAYKYREYHPVNYDGWAVYDLIKEFQRQGVDFNNYNSFNSGNNLNDKLSYDTKFRLSFVNEKDFSMCSSYPEIIVVPAQITDDELKESASFRTKGRIPTLCYFYKENGASIWRSSQTRSGLTYQRNEKDEKLLSAIYDINSTHQNKLCLIIYDARPYLNAFANRFRGAGYENTDNYKNTEICFCEIDNIHCIRTAYTKLNNLLVNKISENKHFLSQLEATLWLNYIYQILKSATEIAAKIIKGHTVLIHCSDGWDRSSQLTSLAQILIDPYYRTLEGFMVLVEKEWLSFGHQFGLRNGLYNAKDHSEDQRAPIFLQWLDCIHQLLTQFPYLFEFNMDFLLFLAYHLNSCKYGSFLFNNEQERKTQESNKRTVSLWTDVLEMGNRKYFVNPFYDSESRLNVLLPKVSYHKLRLWEEHFLRYIPFVSNTSKYLNMKFPLNNRKSSQSCIITKIKSNLEIKSNISTNFQLVEMEKLSDMKKIKEQKEEIDKLNNVIKELSHNLTFKKEDFNVLSTTTKDLLLEINKNKSELVEEDDFVIIKQKSTEK
jgi:hypothetical protein